MNVHRIAPSLWMAVALTVACAGEPQAPLFELTDSAGVAHAVSAGPADPMERALGPAELTIGDGTVVLDDVVGALRLGDGRIIIADGGGSVLYAFASHGAPAGTVGRPGDGPGEFRILESIGLLPGDTVWAYDFSLNRLTFVSPGFDVDRTVTLVPPVGPGRAVGVLPSGDFLVGEAWSSARTAAADQTGLRRDPVAYLRYAPSGELEDTVVVVPGREIVVTVEDGRGVMGSAPLGRNAVHALNGDALLVGDETANQLRRFSGTGELLGVVRWEGGDLRVTDDARSAWLESRLADVDAQRRAAARRDLSEIPLPDRMPAYREVLAASDGGFWVGSFSPDGSESERWWVFDVHGAWLGTVAMPSRFRPLQIGPDWVLGVSRDALDVQRVELRAYEAFEPGE